MQQDIPLRFCLNRPQQPSRPCLLSKHQRAENSNARNEGSATSAVLRTSTQGSLDFERALAWTLPQHSNHRHGPAAFCTPNESTDAVPYTFIAFRLSVHRASLLCPYQSQPQLTRSCLTRTPRHSGTLGASDWRTELYGVTAPSTNAPPWCSAAPASSGLVYPRALAAHV